MPTEYGIRLTDVAGKKTVIKPEHTTVIAAGTTAMPSGLKADNTYGVDIDLPASNIPVADLGVIVIPHSPTKNVIYTRYLSGGNVVYTSHYADSSSSYYTRNDSTGVLTAWSAGARTADDKDTWNPILGCYPIAFWDKMGASTFTKVRLFAATAYLLRSPTDDTNLALSGTASNSGGQALPNPPGGTIANINDNSPITWNGSSFSGTGWGTDVYQWGPSYPYTEMDGSSVETVTLSAASTLAQVDVNYGYDMYPGDSGGNCSFSATIAVEIDSAWHDIATFGGSGGGTGAGTVTVTGFWRRVTAIRVSQSGHVQTGSHSNESVWSTMTIGEIRGWGGSYTDSTENKLVYSIGSSQVVDYLVTMRKWNY